MFGVTVGVLYIYDMNSQIHNTILSDACASVMPLTADDIFNLDKVYGLKSSVVD